MAAYHNANFLSGALLLQAYQMRGAGAVIHSHGMEACLATMIHPGAKEFRVKLKGRYHHHSHSFHACS